MTSIPASRNARATILAPRSWPSRPGFATSTRIFLDELKNPPQVDDSIGDDLGSDIKALIDCVLVFHDMDDVLTTLAESPHKSSLFQVIEN
jgi:hypothetical protein